MPKDHPYITSAKGLVASTKWAVQYFNSHADIEDGAKKVQHYADVIYGWPLSPLI